ncbi:MAG: hypothetical protein NTV44_04710, partial [Firmicutes bacterium]|nr:hypothetical protein [Bacillota bacterium]
TYRLDISFRYPVVVIYVLLIALFITLSIFLFKLKKGNGILKAALGLVALMPIPLLLRHLYGLAIFRFSFVLYILFVVCIVTYTVTVLIIAKKAKKEENELNVLLNKDKK